MFPFGKMPKKNNRHKPIHKGRCHTLKCTNHNDKYGL
ncbi:hypothetical protein T05_10546 [Trichinella murrelli]|uniref:Uncharacterized protein n=1 Tax=Trichinella murrelli TaxID=144512 RepID=A0A0V0STW3_9BILA|nr:hypothetical protein T05_10546 [Trichinella murrelli]